MLSQAVSQENREADLEAMLDQVENDLAIVDFRLGIAAQPAPAPKPNSCLSPYLLLYLVTAIYALTDTSQAAMGLQDDDRTLAYSAIAFIYLTSFAMNANNIVEGFKTTYQAVFRGKLPDDLAPISRRATITSIAIACSLTGYVATTDTIQAYYYASSIPEEYDFKANGWFVLSLVVTLATALNALFSEGFKNYHALHEHASGKQIVYANNVSRIASPIIGHVVGGLSGLNDSLLALVGITSTFNLTSRAAIGIATGASLLNGASEYTLQKQNIRKDCNDLLATLATRKPTPVEITSAIVSLGISSFVAIATQRLSMKMLGDAANIYGIKPTDELVTAAEVYAVIAAIDFVLLSSMYMYPLAAQTGHYLGQSCRFFCDNLTNNETLREKDLAELSIKFSGDTVPLLGAHANPLPVIDEAAAEPRAANDVPLRLFDLPRSQPRRLGMSIRDEFEAAGYRLK